VIDLKNIKAGDYELVALSWDEPLPAKPGMPHDFVRHEQGDIVTLSESEAKRLYGAGAVVRKGERQQASADAAKAAYLAAVAALPEELRGDVTGVELPEPAPSVAPGPPAVKTEGKPPVKE
jgi:hypothetical protein